MPSFFIHIFNSFFSLDFIFIHQFPFLVYENMQARYLISFLYLKVRFLVVGKIKGMIILSILQILFQCLVVEKMEEYFLFFNSKCSPSDVQIQCMLLCCHISFDHCSLSFLISTFLLIFSCDSILDQRHSGLFLLNFHIIESWLFLRLL